MRSRARRAWWRVRSSTEMRLTTLPSPRFSSAQRRCWGVMRNIVVQAQTLGSSEMSLWFFPLSADEYHSTRGLDKAGLIDAVAFLFFHDDGADIGDQILVGGSFAKQRPQVMVVLAEEAGAELAIGGRGGGGGRCPQKPRASRAAHALSARAS